MGCGGSVPADHEGVQTFKSGVVKYNGIGSLTIVDSKTALIVGGGGVCVLDISDPDNVQWLTKVDTGVSHENLNFITLIPNSTFAIVTGYGVAILDYADPANTKCVKVFKKTGVITDSDIVGRTIIADHRTALVVGDSGVGVLDISDPANVQWLTKVKTGVNGDHGNRITVTITTNARERMPMHTPPPPLSPRAQHPKALLSSSLSPPLPPLSLSRALSLSCARLRIVAAL